MTAPTPTHHPETPHANDELLTLPEVADLVRVPVATLRYWRHLGSGPRSLRIGRGADWRSDVYQWLEKHPVTHTAPAEARDCRRRGGQ